MGKVWKKRLLTRRVAARNAAPVPEPAPVVEEKRQVQAKPKPAKSQKLAAKTKRTRKSTKKQHLISYW